MILKEITVLIVKETLIVELTLLVDKAKKSGALYKVLTNRA